MTVELTPDKIPETHLALLVKTASRVVKETNETQALVRVPADKGCYVMWLGLNNENQLVDLYFYTTDIVKAPMRTNSRSSNGLMF